MKFLKHLAQSAALTEIQRGPVEAVALSQRIPGPNFGLVVENIVNLRTGQGSRVFGCATQEGDAHNPVTLSITANMDSLWQPYT